MEKNCRLHAMWVVNVFLHAKSRRTHVQVEFMPDQSLQKHSSRTTIIIRAAGSATIIGGRSGSRSGGVTPKPVRSERARNHNWILCCKEQRQKTVSTTAVN